MAVTVEEFMRRLEAISQHNGVPFGRAHLLFEAESDHSNSVLQYKGYLSLSDALKCFSSKRLS